MKQNLTLLFLQTISMLVTAMVTLSGVSVCKNVLWKGLKVGSISESYVLAFIKKLVAKYSF